MTGEFIREVQFLIDRLTDFEYCSGSMDELWNEFHAHVVPPMSRLQAMLEELEEGKYKPW